MSCSCGSECNANLLYACSGAANTGMLADQIARTLSSDSKGSMTCLAAVGANLSGFIVSARSADKNIVIDGCKVAFVARRSLQKRGFHLNITSRLILESLRDKLQLL